MNDLQKIDSPTAILKALGTPQQAEEYLIDKPQAECPLIHRFGPGIYIREVTLPAGIFAVGHHQNFEHMNIMLQGKVLMLNDDGSTHELVAPMIFVGKPGRKMGYILETVVWQNIYATEETDIEKLEAHYLTKSEHSESVMAEHNERERLSNQENRDDFARLIAEYRMTPEQVRAETENEADQIPFPVGYERLIIKKSNIDGRGMFATSPIEAGERIAPGTIGGMRTPAGRYINHSLTPNAMFVPRTDGDIDLVAIKRISGCRAGFSGDEITVDYREAIDASRSAYQLSKEELCLQS